MPARGLGALTAESLGAMSRGFVFERGGERAVRSVCEGLCGRGALNDDEHLDVDKLTLGRALPALCSQESHRHVAVQEERRASPGLASEI